MDLTFLEDLRVYELGAIASYFKPGMKVLEIGAGAGWQARALAERGCDVKAIDIEAPTRYQAARVFPVDPYDGVHIPCADRQFDIILTSHVLEHVVQIEELLAEMKRVLKSDGIAIHIMPTPCWRILTTLFHYPGVTKEVFVRFFGATRKEVASGEQAKVSAPKRTLIDYLLRFLYPHRHGERGNVWSEIYYFSQSYWQTLFQSQGWRIKEARPLGIIYSGHNLFGKQLSIAARERWAGIIGSSSMMYFLQPPTSSG